jgi:hypothetical protein
MRDDEVRDLKVSLETTLLDGELLNEHGFSPNIYQRIFFSEPITETTAKRRISELWKRLSKSASGKGIAGPVIVAGYSIFKSGRHWELFAEVPGQFASSLKERANLFLHQAWAPTGNIVTAHFQEYAKGKEAFPSKFLEFADDTLSAANPGTGAFVFIRDSKGKIYN